MKSSVQVNHDGGQIIARIECLGESIISPGDRESNVRTEQGDLSAACRHRRVGEPSIGVWKDGDLGREGEACSESQEGEARNARLAAIAEVWYGVTHFSNAGDALHSGDTSSRGGVATDPLLPGDVERLVCCQLC